jgi:hypothetical protein
MNYKKIYSGQQDFTFSPDGIVLVPRAMIEILPECPWQTRDQVNYALAKGWVQIVANMTNAEYTMELLQQ